MTQRTILAAFRRSIPVLALLPAIFACSNSDIDNSPNSSSSELISSSSIELISSSSSELISSSSVAANNNSLLLNFTSDYTTGELRWMAPDATSLSAGALAFGQDSKVFAGSGNIFVLSSYPGTLSCLLPQNIGVESAIKQKRLEADNPYEAAVIGSKGYIALNDADYVQVFDISTCTPSEKINLPISGANASTIKASGDTLLIALQRLENWAATKPGLLVRINAITNTLIDTIQLKLYDPGSSVLSKEKLYVSSQKYNEDYSIDLEKSGIEIVDLATGTSEVLATGTQLGGGANGIALDEENQILYVSIYEYYGSVPVKPVNLSSKSIDTALQSITNSFGGLVFDNEGKKLFIADASGLKIYTPATNSTTAVNQDANALPPYSLAIISN